MDDWLNWAIVEYSFDKNLNPKSIPLFCLQLKELEQVIQMHFKHHSQIWVLRILHVT